MKKLILIMTFFFIGFSTVFAQIDTKFWFAPPDVTGGHGESPIFIRMATLDLAAEVKIYMPALYDYPLFTYNLDPNESASVELTNSIDKLETYGNDEVQNTGLYIKSTAPISAYYEIGHEFNADIFSLKGKNGLGNNFIIPSQTILSNDIGYSFNPQPYSSFDIVATSNNTVVWITPNTDVVGHEKENTFIIKLNKGQTYSVTNISYMVENSLGGSIVKSNKPIAITLKEDSMFNEGCADVIGDQLVPVEVAGNEYVIMRGYLFTDEYSTITGIENNTAIEIHRGGDILEVTIQKGEMYSFQIITPSTYINANKPIYVIQVTGFGCEVGMAVLPSINCRGSKQISFTRATNNFFAINVLVRQEGISGFKFNGDSGIITSSDFIGVSGTNGDWFFAQKEISTSQLASGNAGLLTNSTNSFQVGIVHGDEGTSTKFGYFSAFSTLFIGDDMAICEGDSILLDAGPDKDEYLWNTGSTESTILVKEPGEYIVRAKNGLCELVDTINIEVKKAQFELGNRINICEGDTAIIDAQENFSYLWEDGSTDQFYKTTYPGIYSVEIIDYTGCSAKDSVEVIVNPYPDFTLGNDVVKCPKDTAYLGSIVNNASYLWNTGKTSSTISVTDSALYFVDVTVKGCTSRDSIVVANYIEPLQDSIIGTSVVCPNVTNVIYHLEEIEGDNFQWFIEGGNFSSEKNIPTVTVDWHGANQSATIKSLITNTVGCSSDTLLLPITINEKLAPIAPIGPDTLCINFATDFPLTTGNTTGSIYTWNSNAQLISGQGLSEARFNFPTPGRYQFYVEEHSETQTSVCDGVSTVKEILVYKDSSSLELDYVSINGQEHGVALEWFIENGNSIADEQVYLYRQTQNSDNWTILDSIKVQFFTYIDYDFTNGSYSYILEANNSCDQPLGGITHNTIYLEGSGSPKTDMIHLEWNGYNGWQDRLQGYQIWRKLDSGEFDLLEEVNHSTFRFDRQMAADGFSHAFLVGAVRSDGQLSWSNEIEFTFEHPITIPNVITPNNDGINDALVIDKIHLYPESKLSIFNRFGKIVFETDDYNNDFDASKLAGGTYFYTLQLKEKGSISGVLTVLK